MNIKGTINEPVELRTLGVGEWYTPANGRYPGFSYPAELDRLDHKNDCGFAFYSKGGVCEDDLCLLVHPLTKIGDDFWYKGSEPKADDITQTIDAIFDEIKAWGVRIAHLESIVDGLTPRPVKDHPDLFEDGDTYLLMVPVIDRWERRHYEHHIVTVSCDAETPATFNDQNGDAWDAWDWDDAEFYIRNPKYPEPRAAAEAARTQEQESE